MSRALPDSSSAVAAERAAARARAFQLIHDVQDGLELSAQDVARFVAEAETRGWPDVCCAYLYLDVVRCQEDWEEGMATVTRLLERAEAHTDPVMIALALACRSRLALGSRDSASAVSSEQDLARATVMLEGAEGGVLELASAHIECAIAYAVRSLRELELEHYDQAETLARPAAEAAVLLPALLYNQAEANLNWAAAVRELGDADAVAEQAARAAEAIAAARIPQMPEAWEDELNILALLLQAIAPEAGVKTPPVRGPVRDLYAGYLPLAEALTGADAGVALPLARDAVGAIDRALCPEVHDLARCVAAELEAALAGRETDGLAYARHLARLRWETRLSKLAAMQSLLQAERLRSEHAILSQHAYLDELTGLGNRRALSRYLEAIASEGVTQVATVVLDIDRFKSINDSFGHGVGDSVLIRIAGLLHASVRPGDLAVRLGGDEFLLILSGVPEHAAHSRVQTIHDAITAEPWERLCPRLTVQASLGYACGTPEQHATALAAADAALYRSKASGGDRVSGD
jgi:diguanylate cyclase (GGDEF)-like protein